MNVSNKAQDNSDPVSYTCSCPARGEGGAILLFYRYWENTPNLPSEHASKAKDPNALAEFHKSLSLQLDLGGKFRIAGEGFNITLGGTTTSIAAYIDQCRNHWSFAAIDLSTDEACNAYFKPTAGCACAFGRKAVIKVTAEITPLGITNYSPASWSKVISLSPQDFHSLCEEGSVPLIDVRNHYESRIGYFTTGDGQIAVRPAVRRFSQWPGYVVKHVLGNDVYSQPTGIATYCTGGIRCEKGARWMQEKLAAEGVLGDSPIYTLQGGIVAYQAWMQKEVETGRKRPEDSFFKGKNYVFDARGAIQSATDTQEKVSKCHACGEAEDRLGKCEGTQCHLVLVVCEQCEISGVWCCDDCRYTDMLHQQKEEVASKVRRLCQCESDREKSLWGDGRATLGRAKPQPNTQSKRTK
jgi:predicted sulfurtransferase